MITLTSAIRLRPEATFWFHFKSPELLRNIPKSSTPRSFLIWSKVLTKATFFWTATSARAIALAGCSPLITATGLSVLGRGYQKMFLPSCWRTVLSCSRKWGTEGYSEYMPIKSKRWRMISVICPLRAVIWGGVRSLGWYLWWSTMPNRMFLNFSKSEWSSESSPISCWTSSLKASWLWR